MIPPPNADDGDSYPPEAIWQILSYKTSFGFEEYKGKTIGELKTAGDVYSCYIVGICYAFQGLIKDIPLLSRLEQPPPLYAPS